MMLSMIQMVLVWALLAAATAASAGAPLPPWSAGEIVIATVKRAPPGDWTYGNPPRVSVEVEEVWRGKAKKGAIAVVWGPPQNDFDTDVAIRDYLPAWNENKLNVPNAGSEWIVNGWIIDGVLWTRQDARLEWSEANATYVRKEIETWDAERRREIARRKQESERLAKLRTDWRAGVSDKDIVRLVDEADFVGLTTPGSGWFEIEEILKGQRRALYVDGKCRVFFEIPKKIGPLLESTTRYLVLLSERGLTQEPSRLVYEPVKDGLVIADEAVVNAARAAARTTTVNRRPTVLVYGVGWKTGKDVSLRTKDAVVISGIYDEGLEASDVAKKAADAIAGVNYVLRVTRPPDSGGKVQAMAVHASTLKRVAAQDWPHVDTSDTVERVLKFVTEIVRDEDATRNQRAR